MSATAQIPGLPQQITLPPLRETLFGGRLAGPGGLYNLGNLIGLVSGVVLAVAAAAVAPGGAGMAGGLRATFDYFAGSLSAVCVTLAMAIFFWSGEAYHRAWSRGAPPDPRLNRRGDMLSGWGALALGAGLFLIGEPVLAATAGLLHAIGKFGSALKPESAGGRWPEVWRTTVLVSRVPAFALVTIEIAAAFSMPGGADPMALAGPVTLLGCYLLWTRADLMLFRS
jgi:hypothetical protein